MTGLTFPSQLTEIQAPRIGLIALRADETIEADFRRLMPGHVEWMVSRVPSGADVTPDTLAAMEQSLPAAAACFPEGVRFDAIGYGCTSGAAQIGATRIAQLVQSRAETGAVTEPLSALIAACKHLGITRLALLSPYVASVSDTLRKALAKAGLQTPAFGSFERAREAEVVRIDAASVLAAAETLARSTEVEAVFLSCTNLRTLEVIAPLEDRLNLPVLSSNQVLAWDLLRQSGIRATSQSPGRLFSS